MFQKRVNTPKAASIIYEKHPLTVTESSHKFIGFPLAEDGVFPSKFTGRN
jgi:hypothetical protein